ncbi:response regulator transcription factor [Saccharospirillum mangrovi]|uniref:response regulator transcription factor n=1 Tax=Saccharospirillum mangrovi TaxID=2161747 RepID=UPI000D38A888|nr:response regulator transcription factor [Saccharospirillum mangrovi]
MSRILIVDDEPQIRKFLRISLASQGYDVIEASDGQTGLAQAALAEPALVVLDLGLPDLDGKEVLRRILAERSVPVLVLSVRSDEAEKVRALDLGAEDYVVKPFSVNELLARVRRLLASRSIEPVQPEPRFENEQLSIDVAQHRLLVGGESVVLTRKEWSVLRLLMHSPGRLVTQTALLEAIWGPTHRDDTQYLRNVVRQLRQKLGDDAANPRYIETEPGVGYRFLGQSSGAA